MLLLVSAFGSFGRALDSQSSNSGSNPRVIGMIPCFNNITDIDDATNNPDIVDINDITDITNISNYHGYWSKVHNLLHAFGRISA